MMNRISKFSLWLMAFLCAMPVAWAQGDTQTLFGDGDGSGLKNIGFAVAPGVAFTQMDQATAALFTLRGGVVFGDKLTVGGYYNVSMNQIMPQSETVSGVYMDYWSAGGLVEYTLLANKVVHLTVPLYVGMGEVEMDNEIGVAGLGEANFLVVKPSALLEVNLHKYVRLNIGGGYRVVGNMTYRNFDQSALSGVTGNVSLRFGLFR